MGQAEASIALLLAHVNEAQRGQRHDGEGMSPSDRAQLIGDARAAASWAPAALGEMAALMLAAGCSGTNAAAYERLKAEIYVAAAGEHDQAAARLGRLVTCLALHEKGSAPDARAAAAEKHAAITIARRSGEASECERSKEHTIVIGGSAEARRRTLEGAAVRTLQVAVVEIEGSSIPATGANAIWRRACELLGRPAEDEDAYPVVRLPNEGIGILVHDLDALIERWKDEGEIWCLRRTMQTDPRVVLAATATNWPPKGTTGIGSGRTGASPSPASTRRKRRTRGGEEEAGAARLHARAVAVLPEGGRRTGRPAKERGLTGDLSLGDFDEAEAKRRRQQRGE